MRRIESMEEVKRIELEGLVTFHDFCIEHGLKYSLGAGTMIGAVRHKGFIPWDDDIDIFMLRKEYDRLLDLFNQGNKMNNPDWGIMKETIYPFLKITHKKTIAYEPNWRKEYATGVWIDVFPVDNCGDTDESCRIVQKYMRKNARKLALSCMHYSSKTFIEKIKNIYLFVFQRILKADYRKFKRNILEYKFPDSKRYMGTIVWPLLKGKDLCDIYPTEYFDRYAMIEFEKKNFMIFADFDKILSHRYGDYMVLPEEKDRVSHEIEVYYIN